MKKTIKYKFLKSGTIMGVALLAIAVAGCDKGGSAQTGANKDTDSAKTAEPAEGSGASKEASDNEVAAALKGKLIGLEEGGIVDAELTGNPEYYVLYHSASW